MWNKSIRNPVLCHPVVLGQLTPCHLAAMDGTINRLPKCMVHIQNFIMQDIDGKTPIHHAAERGHLDQIPEE